MSISPSGQQSTHRAEGKGVEPSSPRGRTALAVRPGNPLSGCLPFQWTRRELNPDLQNAVLVSSRWTTSPILQVDLMGVEPTPPTVQRSVASSGMQARLLKGPSGNRTRSPSLPRRCAAGTPTDRRVIPGGVEPPLSWVSSRCLRRWTTGSRVTEVGVEPTESPVSRTGRFSSLRTRSWRVRGLHPAVPAYEAGLGTGPVRSCRPRYRTGHTGLMKASWAPAAPAMCQ